MILVDTGVLLRAFERSSPYQQIILKAFRQQRNQGHLLVTSHQNIAEFWNVVTRPATARGGFGLPSTEAEKRVRVIEKLGSVLPFTPACYAVWRQLLLSHAITGVSVHDARLVATMKSHGMTLNGGDFQRYSGDGITIWSPEEAT